MAVVLDGLAKEMVHSQEQGCCCREWPWGRVVKVVVVEKRMENPGAGW